MSKYSRLKIRANSPQKIPLILLICGKKFNRKVHKVADKKFALIHAIRGKKNHFKSKVTVTVKSESVLLILN